MQRTATIIYLINNINLLSYYVWSCISFTVLYVSYKIIFVKYENRKTNKMQQLDFIINITSNCRISMQHYEGFC